MCINQAHRYLLKDIIYFSLKKNYFLYDSRQKLHYESIKSIINDFWDY